VQDGVSGSQIEDVLLSKELPSMQVAQYLRSTV
jgi:hypothetical protein